MYQYFHQITTHLDEQRCCVTSQKSHCIPLSLATDRRPLPIYQCISNMVRHLMEILTSLFNCCPFHLRIPSCFVTLNTAVVVDYYGEEELIGDGPVLSAQGFSNLARMEQMLASSSVNGGAGENGDQGTAVPGEPYSFLDMSWLRRFPCGCVCLSSTGPRLHCKIATITFSACDVFIIQSHLHYNSSEKFYLQRFVFIFTCICHFVSFIQNVVLCQKV